MPVKASDVITPAAASTVARSYFPQRLRYIETNDQNALGTGEVDPALSMDIQLTREYFVTQAALKQGRQVSGVRFAYGTVSGVDSIVPHQSRFPAHFLSVVRFSNGVGALMGFVKATSSDRWRLEVFADLPRGPAPELAVNQDGFAPPPASRSDYWGDPAQRLTDALHYRCSRTPGCSLALGTVRPTVESVGGGVADAYFSQLVATEQGLRSGGFVVYWTPTIRNLNQPDFPWLQLSSGGWLAFINENGVLSAVSYKGGCFTVAYMGEYLNTLLDEGRYSGDVELDSDLIALELPKRAVSGGLTIVGASSAVISNDPSVCTH